MKANLCPTLVRWCASSFGHNPRPSNAISAVDVRKLLLSSYRGSVIKGLKLLKEYMPLFETAFPIPGEVEGAVVYVLYMTCEDIIEATDTEARLRAIKSATLVLEEYLKIFFPEHDRTNTDFLWSVVYTFVMMNEKFIIGVDSEAREEGLAESLRSTLENFGMPQKMAEEVVVFTQGLRSMIGKPAMDWKMLLFIDSDQNVIGGFHYQLLEVRSVIYAWGEHLWLVPSPYNPEFFTKGLAIIRDELKTQSVARVFLEFNDIWKMRPEEIEVDTAAGLPPKDRIWMWAALRGYELVERVEYRKYKADKKRMREIALSKSAAYGQPSMGPEDPAVTMLTLAFICLDGEMISMDREEYWELVYKAHSTIPGIDPDQDETCLSIREALSQGPESYDFRPLFARFEPRVPSA
jgi:hypothetical protein